MTASELAALVKGLAPAVLHVVSEEVHPVSERVAVLETKASLVVPPDVDAIAKQAAALIHVPRDGKDAEPVDFDVLALRAAELVPVPTNGMDGKDGADGKDVDPALVLELKAEIQALRADLASALTLAADVELLRTAVAGTGAAISEAVTDAVQTAVAALPPAKDGAPGTSVDPDDVVAMVVDQVVPRVLDVLPVPKDGENGKDGTSVTAADVAPLIASEVQKAVTALPVPKDGVGMAGVVISKDGSLIVTLTDGTLRDLGGIVGRDGERGTDGADGLGFDDLHGEYDERGHLWIVMAKGEKVQRMRVPGHVDRGVYKHGDAYLQGEGTTWAGSYWIAQRDTTDKPGDGSKDWRLSVKRGSDGKSITGPPGPQGVKGDPGPIGPARY